MTTELLSVSPEWSALHLRVARGETLNDDERAAYEAVLKRLDEEEERILSTNFLTTVRKTRNELAALEAERIQLTQEREALEAQIVAIEKLLAGSSAAAPER